MIDIKSMTFADIGENFTRIDADRALLLHGFLAKVGETPSFESWETARKDWGTGYKRIKSAATDDAVNTAWSRFVAGLRTYAAENGFSVAVPEKPKATTSEAQRKAEERKNPFASLTLDDARTKQKEILSQVAESQKAGQVPAESVLKSMAQVTETVVKLEKEAGKERLKVAKEKMAPRIDSLKKRINQADERFIALVEALADATDMRNPENVRAAAWDVLRHAMPVAQKAGADKTRRAA